jgi:hypothetical protein
MLAVGVLAAAVAPAAAESTPPAWQSYVESPSSAVVSPVRVVSASGTVSDAAALVRPGGGSTTLTYAPGGTAPVIVLDYGKEVGGFPKFQIDAFSGVPVLHVAYSETLANLSSIGDLAPNSFMSGNPLRVDELPVTSTGVLRSPGLQGGERYEMLTLDSPGSVTLSSAPIDFTGFLGTPSALRGHFLSSDDLLNRIWYAGVYTLNLNQIVPGTSPLPGQLDQSPVIIDGAKRDRAVWSGDQLIADPTAYYSIDPQYVRESLALFGAHPATLANEYAVAVGDASRPGPLPGECSPNTQGLNFCISWSASYSMDFVPALYEYYLYTGDASFARQEWPLVVRQMAWDAQQVDANGLVSVDDTDNADWAGDNPSGELTYVNSVYYKALNDAAALADAIGQPGGSAYRAAAASIKRAVNAQLWHATLGLYDASTSNRGPIVQDANVFAVLSGIAPPARAPGIMNVLTHALASPFGTLDVSSPVPSGYSRLVSPYIGGFQLAAEFESNRTDAALALMRTEWGWMVNHDPGGTAWEKIQPNGVPSALDSTAHAWGTGATSALSRYVLGVAPTTAGYATWTVMPHPGDLAWTEGSVPTPHGNLAVRWNHGTGGSSFDLALDAPAGTDGSVWIPLLGSSRVVKRDGAIVWTGTAAANGASAYRAGDYVVFHHQSGSHTYVWRAPTATCTSRRSELIHLPARIRRWGVLRVRVYVNHRHERTISGSVGAVRVQLRGLAGVVAHVRLVVQTSHGSAQIRRTYHLCRPGSSPRAPHQPDRRMVSVR